MRAVLHISASKLIFYKKSRVRTRKATFSFYLRDKTVLLCDTRKIAAVASWMMKCAADFSYSKDSMTPWRRVHGFIRRQEQLQCCLPSTLHPNTSLLMLRRFTFTASFLLS